MKKLLLVFSHLAFLGFGFAAGIYLLPILTAPEGPTAAEVAAASSTAQYRGEFVRDLEGSDFLHWGEGIVSVGAQSISLEGRLAPGPDYYVYLAPSFVETEAEFEAARDGMVRLGAVKTFENFMVDVPAGVDIGAYTTVVVWCESFGEFITAATYR
jgi:hypothetical protein